MKKEATIYDVIRMCMEQKDCPKCPLYDKGCSVQILGAGGKPTIDKANEAVLKWCEEHPPKTRQTEFLKQFPAVVRDDNGTVMICPASLDATLFCPEGDCAECRCKYWSEEVKDVDNS